MGVTKTSEIEQIEKNFTLGGLFKVPTQISPKPRIGGAKKFCGLMEHYDRSLPLKFYDDLMNRKSIGARTRKIFNRKYVENEPERWPFSFFHSFAFFRATKFRKLNDLDCPVN
jgi:hypothetical protein